MAFRLTGSFRVDAEVTSPLDLSTVSNPLTIARQIAFGQGAGAGSAT